MNSMVLWYDLKKQGATNESMAENPVLRDLSGNGHDATCYNFAWTEESGISTTEYPGALVSDGVDDYCLVEGLPLLNKEDGYTVIAKRKWLDEDNEDSTSFASKATTVNGTEGAFMFEYKDAAGTRKAIRSFGGATIIEEFEKNDITYQSSGSYNGREIIAGGSIDNSDMVLFRFSSNDDRYYGAFALYSLLLFNRDLSTDEIEWVKTNLIETEQ